MADYWKSNAKKYCDFCKCWIADNKPSVDFHEKGKRHKENVAVRLKSISRQSAKDFKAKQKLEDDLKKMEKAALEAYMKDVERNADYTSQQLNMQLGRDSSKGNSSTCEDEESKEEKEEMEVQEKKKKKKKVWHEAVSDEGYTYYWNTETGESVWEPPKEGYKSLNDLKKLEEQEKQKEAKRKSEEERKKEEAAKEKTEEQRAFMQREKMKKRAAVNEPEPPRSVYIGPPPRGNPYGSWTTVKVNKTKTVDLQLPEQKRIEIKVPVLNVTEPEVKFKEKNFVCLESEPNSDTSFKKRKLKSGSKMNMRQRLADD